MPALVLSTGISPAVDAGASRRHSAPAHAGTGISSAADSVHELATGDALYLEGESKSCIFRVEKGVVVFSRLLPGGVAETIGFAFPGDLIGAGALERHMWSAHASLPSRVSRLLPEAAEAIAGMRPDVRKRIAEATELEMELLREHLNGRGRLGIAHRLAALLLVIAAGNAKEGREADVIRDDIACGVVADMLGIEVDELGHGLSELQRRGLVELDEPGALRLVDRAGLERMIEGPQAPAAHRD